MVLPSYVMQMSAPRRNGGRRRRNIIPGEKLVLHLEPLQVEMWGPGPEIVC